jgi:hypothetical protein
VIVQWCCKGVGDMAPKKVKRILDGEVGLQCRFWQRHRILPYELAVERLTERDLDLHVNHYDGTDPITGKAVRDHTAFISLSAGCVERDALRSRNVLHPALRTALIFATERAQRPGWVFTCYVTVAMNPAARIPGVAEEVRELNHRRPYSRFRPEGEIAAKLNVPSRQILCAEHWEPAGKATVQRTGGYRNLGFVHPEALLNMRQMI